MSEIEQPRWNGKITRARREGDVLVFDDIQPFSIGVVSDPLPGQEAAEQLTHQLIVRYGQPIIGVIDRQPRWPEHEFPYLYLPQEEAKIKYTPPIVDDAGIDIYNLVPEHVKQEIRDNIWKYLEQVQRDYPPEPRARGA